MLRRVEVGRRAVEELAVVVLDLDPFGQAVLRCDYHSLGGFVGVHGAARTGGAGRQRVGHETLGQGEGELAVEHRDFLALHRLLGRGLGRLHIQSPQAGSRRQQQDNGFFTQQ
ncbi:hypothetical protein D9M72_635150 [compost metagenome]